MQNSLTTTTPNFFTPSQPHHIMPRSPILTTALNIRGGWGQEKKNENGISKKSYEERSR
jgi:hypothetical protein